VTQRSDIRTDGPSGCCTDVATTPFVHKSLARPGRKQATATEDFEFHISYL